MMLKVKSLSKSFGQNEVIKNLNLSVSNNEQVCIFAPSGAGKSTLINIINKLILPDSGQISVTENKATILQNPSLFWYKNVAENIFYPFKLKKLKITEHTKEVYQNWLNITGLKESETLFPHELSGGMKQKVSIIRSFLLNPDLMIMDEPFNSIDINSKNKIIKFIDETYTQMTKLLITHNIDEIPRLTSKMFWFDSTQLSDYQIFNFDDNNFSEIIGKLLFG